MITNLPTGFAESINATHRKPIQLAHIHIGELTCFYSDTKIGIKDGLMYDYEPRVESWGTLKDTANIDASFDGNSLEVRSMTLTLILTGDARANFVDLLKTGIENSIVEVYQWFMDNPEEPPQLVDVMIAQDPIGFSESSALFQMDLVSVIMKNDPYLWDRQPGAEVRDIVVGRMPNMPLIDLQTARWTTLDKDMDSVDLGVVYIGNGIGFRAGPDQMTIDSEVVAYDWISASAMNITGRGLGGTVPRPHLTGARIFHPDSVFDYAVSAGPVNKITDLYADGEPYVNQATFLISQDPTIVRFLNRPPWVKVAVTDGPVIPSEIYTVNVFANASESALSAPIIAQVENPEMINTQSGLITTLSIWESSDFKYTSIDISPSTIINDNVKSPGDLSGIYGSAGTGPGYMGVKSDNLLGSPSGEQEASFTFYLGDPDLDNIVRDYGSISTVTYNIQFQGFGSIGGKGVDLDFSWYSYCDGTNDNLSFEVACVGYDMDSTDLAYYPFAHVPDDLKSLSTGFSSGIIPEDVLPDAYIQLKMRLIAIRESGTTGWEYTDPVLQIPWFKVWFTLGCIKPGQLYQSRWAETFSVFNNNIGSIDDGIGSVTAHIDYQASIAGDVSGFTCVLEVIGETSDGSRSVLWIQTIHSSSGRQVLLVDLPIYSKNDLAGYKCGMRVTTTPSSTDTQDMSSTVYIYSIKWAIEYGTGAIKTPDEERVVYANDLTCTVYGMLNENPTPPQVIEHLLMNYSPNAAYVDNDWFLRRHLEYDAMGYYFNGVLDGNIRLHEALRQCLFEGMCRFVFGEGYIRLVTYITYQNQGIDFVISDSQVQLRSKQIKNQPTSTIKNDVTAFYDWNAATGEFDSNNTSSDDNSILKYEIQTSRNEYTLIRGDIAPPIITGYNLERRKHPLSIYNLVMFMSGYPLQKGDRVEFDTIYKTGTGIGFVAATNRVFGQGKKEKINTFLIQISEPIQTGPFVDLYDDIEVDDSSIVTAGGTIHLSISDGVEIDDNDFEASPALPSEGYGGSGYGSGGYGQ